MLATCYDNGQSDLQMQFIQIRCQGTKQCSGRLYFNIILLRSSYSSEYFNDRDAKNWLLHIIIFHPRNIRDEASQEAKKRESIFAIYWKKK